jgi:hypothetical protein
MSAFGGKADLASHSHNVALLIAYAGGMAGGQVLFKMAALKGVADGPMVERLFSMMLNRFFAAAVLLYAALTVLWVGY